MQQQNIERCFVCNAESKWVHLFARINQQGLLLGAVAYGVCGDCVQKRVEKVKQGKDGRFIFLLPLLVLCAVGIPTMIYAGSTGARVFGLLLILAGIGIATSVIVQQRKEVKAAREASDEENERTYSVKMCRERAAKSTSQDKLVELKLEYATEAYPIERIAKEAGVTTATATILKLAIMEAVVKTAAEKANSASKL